MPEILLICPAIIFIAGILAPVLRKIVGDKAGYLLSLAPFTAFGLLVSQGGVVASGDVLRFSLDWFGALGASADMRLDGLGFLMAVFGDWDRGLYFDLCAGVFARSSALGRFFLYLMLFMGAMLGLCAFG